MSVLIMLGVAAMLLSLFVASGPLLLLGCLVVVFAAVEYNHTAMLDGARRG